MARTHAPFLCVPLQWSLYLGRHGSDAGELRGAAHGMKLDSTRNGWMTAPETRAVMAALGEGNARFVGGPVRNALLDKPVSDIDIATPLKPDEVVKRLEAAKLKAVPTGIEHGTITAVSGG